MNLFAVAGSPILHSRSSLLFQAAYQNYGMDAAYFRMYASSAQEAMLLFEELGLKAMNITAPLKKEIVKSADILSPEAKALDACNIILRMDDGLHAYNTDPDGVAGALHSRGIDICGMPCMVVGAGGAACAAAYSLKKLGGMVTIVNRTLENARSAAHKLGCMFCGIDEIWQKLNTMKIIVNTIPSDILAMQKLNASHIILDAVYPNDMLAMKAASDGAMYISGGEWLLHQAIPAYRLFMCKEPCADSMKMVSMTKNIVPKHISLIGFMGAGKSTIAPLLAGMLGMRCIDIDYEIERKCMASIAQIFAAKGEDYFRRMEVDTIKQALNSDEAAVIACGGGAIVTSSVCSMLREQSIAVWLYASAARCIADDAQWSKRPMLTQCCNPMLQAQSLLQKRIPLYAKTAWLLINSANTTPQQTADTLYMELRKNIK
jgi:shikimate dehydrogenase